MRHRILTLSLAPVFVAAGVVLAQVEVQPATAPGISPGIAPPIISPATTTTAPASRESAETVLQNLLHEQGTLGTTEPAIVSTTGPKLEANGLLREGQQLQVRSGHLKKDEAGKSEFVFDDRQEPHYSPMGVIPSRRLERMEDVAFAEGRSGADTDFTIDAEVTEYRGKNYLYINSNPLGMPKRPAATGTAPASAPAVASAPASVAVVAPQTPTIALLPETTIIAGRYGRFVKDAKTGLELITFQADGRKMFDPPLGLVPCKMLAFLEEKSEMGEKPLRFMVSGEVTMYRGKNYLYLRTAWEVPDLNQGIGNFDPGATNKPPPQKSIKPGG